MVRRFADTIEQLAGKPMSEQGEELSGIFTEWKGDSRQIDDVLVIGFRV